MTHPSSPQPNKAVISKGWIVAGVVGCVASLAFATIAGLIVAFLFVRQGDERAAAPVKEEGVNEEATAGSDPKTPTTRSAARPFAVGDRVEIEASNHWVPCVVVENEPPSIMRVRCDAYPTLSRDAGIYTVDRDNPTAVRHATGEIGEIAPEPTPSREAAPPAGLKRGEYACYGSGGRVMAGVGFKVLSGDRYEDLEGNERGSFSISGTTVRFRGGHLDGQEGRDLRGHNFTIAGQAECEPY